jgi:hypothetical protein
MNYHILPAGTTSETVLLEIRANNNNPATGLAFNTAGLVCRYTRPGEAPVAITLANQTVTGAYLSGGFKEVDATNTPGLYRLDIPDAALAVGKDQVMISFHGYSASSTSFFMYQLGGIVTEGNIATASYKLKSDQTTCDDKLDLYVGNTITINLQLVDANLVPVAVGTSTCLVRVYDISGNFVTNYTPTVQYNANGEISFVISTAVTSVAGAYNIYVSRTGASDTISFGPLQLRVRSL